MSDNDKRGIAERITGIKGDTPEAVRQRALNSLADEPVRIMEGLVVRPGDRLILTVPESMPAQRVAELSEALSEHLPDIECILIQGVTGVKVESGD